MSVVAGDLLKARTLGTSLVVQWLRLHAHDARGLCLSPGQGSGSLMPQLKILHAQPRHRAAK